MSNLVWILSFVLLCVACEEQPAALSRDTTSPADAAPDALTPPDLDPDAPQSPELGGTDGPPDLASDLDHDKTIGSDVTPLLDTAADIYSDTHSSPTEVLLFDQNGLQFVAADRGFDPLVKAGDPIPMSNWLSPHDYYDGEFRIRYVIEGPADQQGGKLQICIWTMPGYSPESCSDQVLHTGVGEYFNTKLAPSTWWKKSQPLDFSQPENFLIRVVLRGESGCNVTNYPSVPNACWNEWPAFEQMLYRVTIVMVPQGKTFSGWTNYP